MATDLVEINPEEPQPEVLERAAAAVRRGRVVAIPTDALYTLVADPFNLRAVTQRVSGQGARAAPLAADPGARHHDGGRTRGRAEQPVLHSGAPFLAGAADDHRAGRRPRFPLKVTGNTGRLALRQSRSEVAHDS